MRFAIAYIILFLYVVSAIVFWGISLNKKSEEIYILQKENLSLHQQLNPGHQTNQLLLEIEDKKSRSRKQYIGEGVTFLFIILASAIFVYRVFQKQIKLSKLQRNFMMSVTHELKTPLAGIILNLQTLMKRKVDEDMQIRLLNISENEALRLSDLCNNILMATQIDDGERFGTLESCDINSVIETSIMQFQRNYPRRKIEYTLPQKNQETRGDESLWTIIISNLIENARKYSPENTIIKVMLTPDRIQVIDEGLGIKDEDKKKIFQKFYRVGDENTRNTKGTGIGLYLVKKILNMLKYDIIVKNNAPSGSIFEIKI